MKLRAKVRRATGATKHSIGTVVDGRPVALRGVPEPVSAEIVAEGTAFLLLRLDERGVCVADTWHPKIDDAKRMAQAEYCIEERDWMSD